MNQPANDPNSPAFIEQVAKMAMRLSQSHLSDYGTARSRHDFTQRQLLTCLILRNHLKTTYRGVLDFVRVNPTLRQCLGLADKLPHFTTLQKFNARGSVVDTVQQLNVMINRALTMQDPAAMSAPEERLQECSSASPMNTSQTVRTTGTINR